MEDYLVPGGQAQAEYIEKKSRFIGQVFPITTEQEAKATIERVRRQHYDARQLLVLHLKIRAEALQR